MNCAWVQERLLLYRENEVPQRERQQIGQHLEQCERCAGELEALLETHELLDGALRREVSAPATLDDRVLLAGSDRGIAVVSRGPLAWPPFRVGWTARRRLGAAAAVACLLFAGFFAGRWQSGLKSPPGTAAVPVPEAPQSPTLSLALLGDDHLKYLANSQPAQVRGPDPQTVSRGLTLLLKFPVAEVDLRPEGARLLGGRKCQVHGVPIAFLLYDWQGERVSLYQIDGRKIALPLLQQVEFEGRIFQVAAADGLTYVGWRSGAMNFVMVSGAPPERLLRLACCASGMAART